MTGQAVCNVIQAFPVLLILAQKADKCLKTPFVYKPPSPTHPPEYYEAYDTLLHSLLSDKCQKPCHNYPSYPTYHSYPTYSDHHGYGYGNYPDGYVGYFHNRYQAAAGLNLSTDYSYKSNYAPTQVYNTKHKHKLVVVKTKRKKSAKLQGFFPQRDNRRITPASPFGIIQNFIPDPNRIRNTLSGILHYQPGNVVNNQNNGQNDYNGPYGYDNYNNRPNYYDNGPYGYDNYNNRPRYNYQPNPPNNVRFPVNDDANFGTQTSNNDVNQNPGLVSGTVGENSGLVSGTVGENPGLVSGTVGENLGLVSGAVGENLGQVSGTVDENPGLVSETVGKNPGLVSGTVNQDQGYNNYGFGQKDATEEPGYGKDSGLISGTQDGLDSGNKFGEGNGGLISGTVGDNPQQGDVAFGNRNGFNTGTSDRAFGSFDLH